MSIIFGIRKPDGEIVDDTELLRLAHRTERYAPDGTFVTSAGRVGMGFQPFHTTERSRLEDQPLVDEHGSLLVFDGRLDNHEELRYKLGIREPRVADSQLILSAFVRWDESCFAQFVGDWAIALWSAAKQTLYLARDHAGTRTLFFQHVSGALQWSTYLDSLLLPETSHQLDKEYVASYLASRPIRDLTPYRGIRAVLPAHYKRVMADAVVAKPHWSSMASGNIRYGSDEEYEVHFLQLFKTSVVRRTTPGGKILAQLSGGMDSTSIVCMSDHIRTSQGAPPAELLDTLSYYDDSEPNWQERPYFSIVESARGKTGIHIDRSDWHPTLEPLDQSEGVALWPGWHGGSAEQARKFDDLVRARGYRAIVSGIGGDELLGGVPTPLPELAEYLVSGSPAKLFRRSADWCLTDRSPLLHLLFQTVKFTINLYRQPGPDVTKMPSWIAPDLRKLCFDLKHREIEGGKRLGFSPTALGNGITWWAILETLPHLIPPLLTRYEYRYPYLDRDLVDFLLRIPRDQLLRPGQRRSLMRRALKDIVLPEILARRRKGFVIRGPLTLVQQEKEKIEQLFARSFLGEHGFIDPVRLRSTLELVARGKAIDQLQTLLRAIALELWFKSRAQGFTPDKQRAHKFPVNQVA
jgi:asparagine synthase (glutamine-hydrolysing)